MPQPLKFSAEDPRIHHSAVDAYSAQRPWTMAAIHAALQGAPPPADGKAPRMSSAVRGVIARLESDGHLQVSKEAGALGRSLRVWVPPRLREPGVTAANLGVALTTFLESGAKAASKNVLLSTLRSLARQRGAAQVEGRAVIAWVGSYGWNDVPGLHREILGLRSGVHGEALDPTSRRRYRRAWTAWLRFIGRRELMPLAFPAQQRHSTWALWLTDHAASLPPSGRQAILLLAGRWRALGPSLGDLPPTPDDITVEQANHAIAALTKTLGAASKYPHYLRAAWVHMGMRGRGPYAALRELSPVVPAGSHYLVPEDLPLLGREGPAGTLEVLAEAGLPREPWAHFIDWLVSYHGLSRMEFDVRYGRELRAPKRVLKPAGIRRRFAMLRHIAGGALAASISAPGELTPQVLLGTHGRAVLDALQVQHVQRIAAQKRCLDAGLPVPGGEVGVLPLHQRVVGLAMLAEAAAAYAKWQRGRGQGEEWVAIHGAHVATYDAARQEAAIIEEEAKAAQGSVVSPSRQKNTLAIVREHSSLALVEEENRRALEAVRRRPHEHRTAVMVQQQLLGAIVATGQVRVGELAGLTYAAYTDTCDQRTGRTLRFLTLDAARRKVPVVQYVALPEIVVPKVLWDYHRTTGRSLLSGGADVGDVIFCGVRTRRATRLGAAGSLMLGRYFTSWRMAAIKRHPTLKLSAGGWGANGAHAERNRALNLLEDVGRGRLGYALLGHTPDEKTVQMYGHATPETNLESVSLMMEKAPWRAPRIGASATGTVRGKRAQLQEERERDRVHADLWRAAVPFIEEYRAGARSDRDLAEALVRIAPAPPDRAGAPAVAA